MNRRQVIGLALSGMGWSAAQAHTPYGQWVVYRKKHLLIGAHRRDPGTYELAKELTGILAEHLPRARSRVARAPDARRLASLLGTEQLDVAVLGPADAEDMRAGSGQFEPYGAIGILQLAVLDDYVLVAHERFPARHAWLVAAALHAGSVLKENQSSAAEIIDVHPGSALFLSGKPEPKDN